MNPLKNIEFHVWAAATIQDLEERIEVLEKVSKTSGRECNEKKDGFWSAFWGDGDWFQSSRC